MVDPGFPRHGRDKVIIGLFLLKYATGVVLILQCVPFTKRNEVNELDEQQECIPVGFVPPARGSP